MFSPALHIYMDDHQAMITGELELSQRVARENKEADLGRFLEEYHAALQDQRDLLDSFMQKEGKAASPVKQAVTWLAEKIGRLKPNDSLSGYTDLARVLELEMLISGAQLRLLLWETLIWASPTDNQDSVRLEQVKNLSVRHLSSLREYHEHAKRSAFARHED